MPERANEQVLKEYADSLNSMQYLGYVSQFVDTAIKRVHGELLAEIMERGLLDEAAEVYAANEGLFEQPPVVGTKRPGPLAGPVLLVG